MNDIAQNIQYDLDESELIRQSNITKMSSGVLYPRLESSYTKESYLKENNSYSNEKQTEVITSDSLSNMSDQDSERPIFKFNSNPTYSNFNVLQKWEGTVVRKDDDSFMAKLINLTEEKPDEIVEFSYEEIDDEDISLLEIGSKFYWSIGYYTTKYHQKLRTSVIRFRRLPVWTTTDFENAEENLSSIRKSIEW